MQDHTAFPPDALRVLTRLSRQVHQLDGYRTSLSDKEAVLALITTAAADARSEIKELFTEFLQHLRPADRAYLENHGVTLHETAEQRLELESSTGRHLVRRVYRGQVFYEEVDASSNNPTADPLASSAGTERRVYRGQVIDP